MQEETKIEDDFTLIRFQNDTSEPFFANRELGSDMIQFHFGLKGNGKILLSQASSTLELKEEKSLLFYNPKKQTSLHLELAPNSWVISIIVSIEKFHTLFATQTDYITLLSADNNNQKYSTQANISPSMAIVLSQLFHYNFHPSIKNLYYKGKEIGRAHV